MSLESLQQNGGQTTLTFEVSATEACDTKDPTNVNTCCDMDLKAILIGMEGSRFAGVTSDPDARPVAAPTDKGLNVTGVFGQGVSFQLQVVLNGRHTVESLRLGNTYPGNGFRYKLYGSADMCQPGVCCPSFVTGDPTL